MSTQTVAYFNGEFVPTSEARVSVLDSALIWGDMVFETTRTFQGRPFRLHEHLKRLYASMNVADIDCGLTVDEMEQATRELVERNWPAHADDDDLSIVHNVSRGPAHSYAPGFLEPEHATVIISTQSLVPYVGSLAAGFDAGVNAVVPRQRSIPSRLLDPKVKSRSRLHYRLAANEVAREGRDAWAILSDEDGFLTEGTGSNFFLVREGVLLTPEPRNILRGVTRQAVFDLAAELAIDAREINLEPYDALTADEGFFCSTPFCLIPATRFNGKSIGSGEVGPVFRRLADAFGESVGVDFIEQARQFATRRGAD